MSLQVLSYLTLYTVHCNLYYTPFTATPLCLLPSTTHILTLLARTRTHIHACSCARCTAAPLHPSTISDG